MARPVAAAVLMSEVHSTAAFSRSTLEPSHNSAMGMPSTPTMATPFASSSLETRPSSTLLNISPLLDCNQPGLELADSSPPRVLHGSFPGGRRGPKLRGCRRLRSHRVHAHDLGHPLMHRLVVGVGAEHVF